jgi:3-deoxy-D-manno-octulosonate 8-phosphate phosphatase KdsC-like HAD superfamily phosphatase
MGSGPLNLKLSKVFYMKLMKKIKIKIFPTAGAWTQAKQVKVDLAKDGGQALKREMANFVANLAETARATNDREEFSIVGLN